MAQKLLDDYPEYQAYKRVKSFYIYNRFIENLSYELQELLRQAKNECDFIEKENPRFHKIFILDSLIDLARIES